MVRIPIHSCGWSILGLLLLAGAQSAHAQATTGWGASTGRDHYYLWSNAGQLAPGDTLRVRYVLMSTADTTVTVLVQPCHLELVTRLELRDGSERCSEAKQHLAPGDSVWADKVWVVASPPGRYDLTIRLMTTYQGMPVGNSSGTQVLVVPVDSVRRTSGDPARSTPDVRVPFTVQFSRASAQVAVTERDIERVVEHAITKSGYMPVRVTPAAGTAMTDLAPYLVLDVEIGENGDYRLTRCWIGKGGKRLSGLCDKPNTGGVSSPVVFGARLADEIEEEMKWRRVSRLDCPDQH